MINRADPKGKTVSLFVTCIVDMIYPNTGLSTVEVLERLGCKVDFPMSQTCCGQMGFNGGYRRDAKKVAEHFLQTFKDSEVIVSPSGSCTTMIRHYYTELFADDPKWHEIAEQVMAKTWELTEFIVDGLGVEDVGVTLQKPVRAATHDACHGLRELKLHKQARTLLSHVANLELVTLEGADQCCGFGGLFAIKMPEISGAMLNDKVQAIDKSGAEVIITGDASCLTQMNGGLNRQQHRQRVIHIADVLAGKIGQDD